MFTLYPQAFCTPAADVNMSLAPLFRFLDDFDNYSREVKSAKPTRKTPSRAARSGLASFTPKFDVRETEDSYELIGELPGLERENVSIEFTEPQTIVIRGRVERSYGPDKSANATTNSSQTSGTTGATSQNQTHNSHHATVEDSPDEDDDFESISPSTTTPVATPKTTPAVAESSPAAPAQEVAKAPATTTTTKDQAKYWLWERSVGEFSRAFSFPSLVDHESVTAGLNNGILTVKVPKAKMPATRRIAIN
jgi:HSP20 family molecular chaperone IbpA